MPWPRIEDDYFQHPKIRALPYQAVLLDLGGIVFCARNLTDGQILAGELGAVVPSLPNPQRWAKALIEGRRWEADPTGFRVHDYLVYHKTRAVILAERAEESARKARAKAGGNRTGRGTSHTNTHPPGLELGGSDPTKSAVGYPADAPVENGKKPSPSRLDRPQNAVLGKILKYQPGWLGKLTHGGITKLNGDYTYPVVFEAMQELSMRLANGSAPHIREPYGYLEGMCKASEHTEPVKG